MQYLPFVLFDDARGLVLSLQTSCPKVRKFKIDKGGGIFHPLQTIQTKGVPMDVNITHQVSAHLPVSHTIKPRYGRFHGGYAIFRGRCGCLHGRCCGSFHERSFHAVSSMEASTEGPFCLASVGPSMGPSMEARPSTDHQVCQEIFLC